MSTREPVVLHREDPTREPLVGHVKVTREDWLNVAREILINDGVDSVKILAIGDRLQVSRSSFYWYFKSRKQLLNALLDDWAGQNTASIISKCELPAPSIAVALCNFFHCFIDPALFNHGLDFAVREWSRRDPSVRRRIDRADRDRLDAVTKMFARHGYGAEAADVRARILYFMQLGYHALEVHEPMAERMKRLNGYIEGFTGVAPAPGEIEEYADLFLSYEQV